VSNGPAVPQNTSHKRWMQPQPVLAKRNPNRAEVHVYMEHHQMNHQRASLQRTEQRQTNPAPVTGQATLLYVMHMKMYYQTRQPLYLKNPSPTPAKAPPEQPRRLQSKQGASRAQPRCLPQHSRARHASQTGLSPSRRSPQSSSAPPPPAPPGPAAAP